MTLPTPTPDVRVYLVAIVVAGGLGAAWLAAAAHACRPARRPTAYLQVYAGVLALVCLASACGPVDAGAPALTPMLVSGASGVAGAAVVVRAERRVRRRARRWRRPAVVPGPPATAWADPSRSPAIPGRAARSAGWGERRRPPAVPAMRPPGVAADAALVRPDLAGGAASRRSVVALLLLVAALEELVFRGVLLELALGVSAAGAVLAAALVPAFALTHVQFGWPEVAAKLPLAVVATALVLATGTVVGAVVCHGVVNARAVR